jgi:transcriptional regulator with XRE-family HTH domain
MIVTDRNTYLKGVGERIRKAREGLEYTREELSSKAGLSIDMLKKLENGSTDPKATSVIKICKALDISADNILFGGDYDTPKDFLNIPNLSLLNKKSLSCLSIS